LHESGVSFINIPQEIKIYILSSINDDTIVEILYILLEGKVPFTDIPQYLLNDIAINYKTTYIIEILIEEHGISFTDIPQDIIDKIKSNHKYEIIKMSILERNGVVF